MTRVELVPMFWCDERVVDLGPYVPSVDDEGRVAFTALHADGGTSLCVATERGVDEVVVSGGDVDAFVSHPDLDARGDLSVYARLRDGRTAVVRVRDARVEVLVAAGAGFAAIGPAGPTMNDAGAIAFRASREGGCEGAYVVDDGGVRAIATAPSYGAIDGLPVVNASGDAVVRVGGSTRPSVVLRSRGGDERRLFEGMAELGRFAGLADDGVIGVAARRAAGWTFVRTRCGGVEDVLVPGAFEHVRGGLLVAGGLLAVYATPCGGAPSVLVGPSERDHVLLAIGAPTFGSALVDFALNPVSGSNRGWLAVRISLADGRKAIARVLAPVTPW